MLDIGHRGSSTAAKAACSLRFRRFAATGPRFDTTILSESPG